MSITIDGTGTITGISAGGLPDGSITNADLAGSITDAKLSGTTCKAWVNFNGTGTVAIRASYNVSSITDNGTGDYTVTFTTAMADANYSAVVCGSRFINTTNWYVPWIATKADAVTSSSCRIEGNTWNGYPVNYQDIDLVMVSVFR